MKRVFLIFAIIVSLGAVCYGQEPQKHRIDKALESCIDKDSSTAGMVQCIGKAYEQWDRELNRAYNELMKRLDAGGKTSLKAAQLQWLKFRDSEFKLIDSIYSKLQGTMYIPMHSENRMEIIKKRALELESRLNMAKEAQ